MQCRVILLHLSPTKRLQQHPKPIAVSSGAASVCKPVLYLAIGSVKLRACLKISSKDNFVHIQEGFSCHYCCLLHTCEISIAQG